MAERILHLTVAQSGQRLDRFLAEHVSDLSRSQLQRLIRESRVRVDGADAKPSLKLEAGQRVSLEMPPAAAPVLAAERIDVPIIYEDADVVVVDKPVGMVAHPGHGVSSGTLVNALLARYPEMRAFEDSLRPGIVHRLDKDTSGVMVVAKNHVALQNLQRQFAARRVKKIYWALVHGTLQTQRGLIEASIGRSRRDPTHMAIAGKAERSARTAFKVLEPFERYTLVEAQPLTGRTHQIRLHFAGLNHPIVGDQAYGKRGESLGLRRQFLHARSLRFVLPSTGMEREFSSELPPDLQRVLDYLRAQSRGSSR